MSGLSKLAIVWFVLTAVVVGIDLTFVLYRPAYVPGAAVQPAHPLATTFPFDSWVLYSTFDHRYAVNDDAFVVVQSYCNLIEVVVQLLAVVLSLAGAYSTSHKLALVVSMMTLYKTVMYGLMEHVEGGKFTHHNETKDLILMVVIPSSFWILIPAILAKRSWSALTVRAKESASAALKKKK